VVSYNCFSKTLYQSTCRKVQAKVYHTEVPVRIIAAHSASARTPQHSTYSMHYRRLWAYPEPPYTHSNIRIGHYKELCAAATAL
jgi:hypothetical protein